MGRDGRRRYDPASRERLVAACLEPGVSASRLALEHGVNANLVRKWIKKAKQVRPVPAPPAFVPVQVSTDLSLAVQRSGLDMHSTPKVEQSTRPERIEKLPSPAKVSASLPNGVSLTVWRSPARDGFARRKGFDRCGTGDGDLGASMKRGAEALLALPQDSFGDVADGLMAMANAMRKAIGGSSGPFYATGLMRASRHLAGSDRPTGKQLAEAFVAAIEAISTLGGAKPGDRTMIDALYPAATTFRDKLAAGVPVKDAWRSAVKAGSDGAEATKAMKPRLGRASYLGDRAVGHADGGAVAVSIWLDATV